VLQGTLTKEITFLVKQMANRPKRNQKRMAGLLKLLEKVWHTSLIAALGK
jgi:hypothetical protein